MINTITDTLMALWNSTWKGKVLPGLVAFIIVGVSMSCFFFADKAASLLASALCP